MSLRRHFLNKLLLVLLVWPGLAMASPLYRVTWLPPDFTAAGLDGAGRVVGTARGGAAVWSPGGATYLGTLLPGSEGLAINAGGAIVGAGMKATRGKADPALVNKLIAEKTK